MNNTLNKLIRYFTQKPKTLFLVDGIGALMTTFYLFFVLRPFNAYFGMPVSILTYLSLIGLVFSVYSLTCFFLLAGNPSPFLKLIRSGNLFYCAVTSVLVFYHFGNLTTWGLLYFTLEIAIILLIVYIESKVINALKK